jgi:small ligand-binding sensory domain FIST
VGVVLGGDVAVRTAVAHVSRPVGPPMTVTASEGEAVIALAGRPAMDRIDAVLADLSGQDQALASCGLLLGTVFDEYADDHGIGDYSVQAVLGIDDDSRAIMLADHVPVGTTVRLHVVDPLAARADLDAAIAGAALDDEIEGALLFAGVPRGGAIGDPAGDAQAVRRGTAARGVSGMLTVGGFGPVVGSNRILGFASAILVLGQSAPDRVLTA